MAEAAGEARVSEYLAYLALERRLARRTVEAYGRDLRAYLSVLAAKPPLGIGDPEQATADSLREYLATLHDRGLKARSRARARSALRGFYRYLARERVIASDPSRDVESPKVHRDLPSTLPPDAMQRLLESAGGPRPLDQRDRALLELAYGAGLRASELTDLPVEAIDLRERWLRVQGKGGKERLLPLGAPAVLAIRRYLNGPRPGLLRKRPDPGTLFLNAQGGRLSRMGFWKIVRKHAVGAGLVGADVHPHSLRHSFATHLLSGGASLRVVQELLGHANVKTTEIYTAVDRDHLRRAHREYHPRG